MSTKTIQEQIKQDNDSQTSLVNDINKMRLANKNSWFNWSFIYNNKKVCIKCYGTWLQIGLVYDLDNRGISIIESETRISSGMNLKVGEFKEFFFNLFESIDFGNYNYKAAEVLPC